MKFSTLHTIPLYLGCIMLLCMACRDDRESEMDITHRLIIVYLAGDNDLSAEIKQKTNALTTGFLNTDNPRNNRLVVYQDTHNANPQLIEIAPHLSGHQRVLATYPTQNSASAATLTDVLNDAIRTCPAQSYGLILFSHGTAWLPATALNNPFLKTEKDETHTAAKQHTRTVAVDGTDEMDLVDFATVLPLPNKQKWAFILFENCYMGSVEVAYELKDKTEALIASATEIVSSGMTEVYPFALHHLYQPTPDLKAFAEDFFNHWNNKTGDYRSATISVTRTEHIDELATLARSAFEHGQPDEATIGSLQHFNRNPWHLFFDLKETLLAVRPALEDDVNVLLPRIITYAAATPTFLKEQPYGFEIWQHCGLSCYIYQSSLETLNRKHRQLSWSRKVFL